MRLLRFLRSGTAAPSPDTPVMPAGDASNGVIDRGDPIAATDLPGSRLERYWW